MAEEKLSMGEIEDCVVNKYDPIKDDFKLMWNECKEQELYHTFENWWSDFIRWKIENYEQKNG